MPRPLKDPAVRQRRNRESTAATLPGSPATPQLLPDREDGAKWRREAVQIWTLAWESPMAKEYTEADVPGLLLLADLTHAYWTKPETKLAGEIRQQRMSYGLDPMARRRLGWKLTPAPAAKVEPLTPPVRARDPRLRAVS